MGLTVLTVVEKLKEVGLPEVQAAALTRAIEAVATAKAELVEARMNKDLETDVERSDASFEKTAREQTRWFATIVFSAIGLLSRSTESPRISSESGRRRKGASKAGTENKRHRKHGTPGRRKGRVRSAASLGGPDPGATRRLCPGRIARALLGFIFEEVSKT